MKNLHVKKGDVVRVLSGKDRGKTGKIIRAFPKSSKVIVEGLNISKKHQRPRKTNEKGQIVETAMPIHVSNVGKIQ